VPYITRHRGLSQNSDWICDLREQFYFSTTAGSIVFFAACRKLVHLQGLSCDLVDRPLRSKKGDPRNQTN